MPDTVTVVTVMPKCDFDGKVAAYDGKTVYGSWAYMCPDCFDHFGMGLGLGKGQKLELRK